MRTDQTLNFMRPSTQNLATGHRPLSGRFEIFTGAYPLVRDDATKQGFPVLGKHLNDASEHDSYRFLRRPNERRLGVR